MHPIVLLFVISLLHAYEARVQLANGRNRCEGRVEVLSFGVWGTVCDDGWDMVDANVVCKQLNCGVAVEVSANSRFGPGLGLIALDDVDCKGHEADLRQCGSPGWGIHNCGHGEDVGITCTGPVSPVNGTVDLLSSSSDSCNLTVTCSTQDSHHIISTFRCDTNTCSQEEGGERSKVTTSGSSLRVSLSNGVSVICSHSNQVSSDEHITMIRDFCFVNPGPEPSIIIAFVTVIVVLVIIAIAAAFVRHRIKGKHESVDTMYQNVQFKRVIPLPDQNPTDDAAAPSPSSLIEVGSITLTEAGDTTQPESL